MERQSAAEAERSLRLARLQREITSIVSSYGALLNLSAVNDATGATDVDAARIKSSAAVLTAQVEALLGLIRELRLDTFLYVKDGEARQGETSE